MAGREEVANSLTSHASTAITHIASGPPKRPEFLPSSFLRRLGKKHYKMHMSKWASQTLIRIYEALLGMHSLLQCV